MTRRRSRSVRTSFVTVLLTVAASVAGCGNDFDALFANQASSGPNDAGTTSDGRSSTADGSNEPSTCGAPRECNPQDVCLGNSCTNTCSGCACSCPTFDCSDGELDTCLTTCSEGTTCSADCSAEKDCSLVAHGAVATLACDGRMDRCAMTCDKGASCEMTCDLDGDDARCIALCDATSSCLVDCGDVRSCDVQCPGGKKQTCPQAGIVTCNRDCPT